MYRILPFLLTAALGACTVAPALQLAPRQVASQIAADLEAGNETEARALFARYAADERYRTALYPALFDLAEERYDRSEDEAAIAIMRLVNEAYPESMAAKEALLYALFLRRAGTDTVDRATLDEIGGLLNALGDSPQHPAWVHLAATQYWIDRGRAPQAREAFEGFQAAWNGRPTYLGVYVTELERWVATHS